MKANYSWHQAANRDSLADNLAVALTAQIRDCIEQRGSAVLALSGGATPKPLFAALANADLDWSRVVITLVDERWVAETHELSNAAFIREHFLDAVSGDVVFVPLYVAANNVELSFDAVLSNYCAKTNSTVRQPREFDAVVLGMGSDGHIASFFPDADNIAALLDPDADQVLHRCVSKSTQVERITWALPMLLKAQFLALHITGATKKSVFEKAANGGDVTKYPVRSAIFQNKTPLNIYYAD